MEIKLSLEMDRIVRIPGVTVAGKKNVITFESSAYSLDKLEVIVSNGEKQKTYNVKNKAIDITELCHKACVIEFAIALIVKGKKVKTWDVEPLVVREVDGTFKLLPEITAIREDMARLQRVIIELNNKINDSV
jgi:hypothetical protein